MNHKMRALLLTAAMLSCLVGSAYAVDQVSFPFTIAPDTLEIPLGPQPVTLTVSNDNVMRGIALSYDLTNIDAASAVVVGTPTVNGGVLGSQRIVATSANDGVVYAAGRDPVGDDNPAGSSGLITFTVDVAGVSGQLAVLSVSGVNCNAGSVLYVGTAGEKTLVPGATVVLKIKAAISADLDGQCPSPGYNTVEGGAVAAQIGTTVNAGNFVSLDLLSIKKDGLPAVPTNAPAVVGLGLVDVPAATDLILSWESAVGEAGSWEFCFVAVNDLNDSGTVCVTFQVDPVGADAVVWAGGHIEFTCGAGPFAQALVADVTTSDDTTYGVVGPFIMVNSGGSAFFSSPVTIPDVVYPPAWSVFESQSTNTYGNDALDPDSMLWGLIDFGGTALNPGTYGVTVNATLADAEGIIEIDTLTLPPNNFLSFNVTNSGVVIPTYGPGCYALTCIRNIAPTVICPVASFGPVVFGNLVEIPGFSYNDPDGGPGPYTFSICSIEKNGAPAVPTNAPTFVGDEFNWQTAAIPADTGTWTFCVRVNDGADDSPECCCFDVTVIGQTPFCFSIDTVSTLSNADVTVCVYLEKLAGLQLAGGFDLLICFDCSILTFKGATVGQALIDHEWEFFTYRLESTNPCKVRLVAIADMNNSNVHPDDENPVGEVACLHFRTSNDRTVACQKAAIRFCWEDCGDNTISSRDGYTLWVVSLPDGGIIDINGQQIYGVEPDPWGYNATVVEAGCPSDKYDIEPFICFENGWIRIVCPGEIDDRGDINLNGLAYEIADAVLYSNYFIQGSGVLDPNFFEAQIAASDVNGDGSPLTVADLVYLIRVITGDALPVPDDFNGKAGAIAGTIRVNAIQQGTHVTVNTSSEQELGAARFVFKYTGTEISDVSLVGRAADMQVGYQAKNGELNVLVIPTIGEKSIAKQSVAAGSGEVLSITTSGGGKVELVSVEAATFMGDALEAKANLPTAFALHQNFPNPFNPSTEMAIDVPNKADYVLSIYNIAGQVVKTFSGSADAGTLRIVWDGTNNQGGKVASGVYFYKAQIADFTAVRKMVLMK